jgi:hypothetical protein
VPILDIGDGAPIRCELHFQDEPPHYWTQCPKPAERWLDRGTVYKFGQWMADHPKAVILIVTGELREKAVCDKHYQVVTNLL